jgi:hypothetical protein
MPTRQERRDSERVPCKLVCHFELTKLVDSSTSTMAAISRMLETVAVATVQTERFIALYYDC